MNQSETVLQPEELRPATDLTGRVLEQLGRILLGQGALHRMVLIGVLSRGHILLEGVPGVGKTVLIKALGQVLNLTFGRVQFTPDLMPGDILGAHILQPSDSGRREMVFQPGPVFTNILLADEINRAPPPRRSRPCWRPCRNGPSPSWAPPVRCRTRSSSWPRRTRLNWR